MELDAALAMARATRHSTIVALKKDGKPQLSNVAHVVGDDGIVRVSITATRAKYHNLRRTPWAALHVNGATVWSYAVLECDAELTPVAADPHDATVDELVEVYRGIGGEHSDWEEYRAAMVSDQRLVVRLTPTYAYGIEDRRTGQ
ncbi:PPOX class F420-dependent oxidoreductase [Nocardioides sp. DS6]|uniref:PPOX class F420-dependent oxidoreductase n=1 Tax=Nocardioides eburneus TaxID=3231482 RepID=A0ABV3T2J7_9ACTN